jgi:hypothetical protein
MITSRDVAEQQAAARYLGLSTPAEKLARDRLLASSFFVVRNDGGERGERIVCDRCTTYHDYISWCCLRRPFIGLGAAIHVIARVRSEDARAHVFGKRLENLSATHPRSYANQVQGVGEDLLAFAVGTVEPISSAEAARLTFAIQCRDVSFDPSQ